MHPENDIAIPDAIDQRPRFELTRSEWEAAMRRHEERFSQHVEPHVRRRSHHQKDPVADFLFEYYRFRPAHLQRWHPGTGVLLLDADEERFPSGNGYIQTDRGRMLWPVLDILGSTWERFETGTRWILSLLIATQNRPPRFGCFGLHEWAMLYRDTEQRHGEESLRVTPERLAEVVESSGLRCTHFDAFRFFTDKARPLNPRQLTHEDMVDFDQPGCLHANMDVYRWAFKRSPWIPSNLILDAFLLAMDIRTLDMASSPYDLKKYGLEPVPVENEEGRKTFVAQQQAFSERARALRTDRISEYQYLTDRLAALHADFAIPRPTS